MLTSKQKELLNYITEEINRTEVAPSFDEMKKHLGLKSKSGVHRLVKALEERGHIVRLAHRARAIALPSNLPPTLAQRNAIHQINGVIRDANKGYVSKAFALSRISEICNMNMGGV